jgi:hypothetical protein
MVDDFGGSGHEATNRELRNVLGDRLEFLGKESSGAKNRLFRQVHCVEDVLLDRCRGRKQR